MKSDDDKLRDYFKKSGLMDPEGHRHIQFDWTRWYAHNFVQHHRSRSPRAAWQIIAVLFFATLLVVPAVLRSRSQAAERQQQSPTTMARLIALRLGDPFAWRFSFTHRSHALVISANAGRGQFSRVPGGREYQSFRAVVTARETQVTLTGTDGQPRTSHLVLGPAPEFHGGQSLKSVTDGPGSMAGWASNVEFFTNHPHAQATVTLTNVRATHLESAIGSWLTGNKAVVLLSLKQGSWHAQYILTPGGGTPAPPDLRVSGFHWSFHVPPDSRPIYLSSSLRKRMLRWGQSVWGPTVTGYHYAAPSPDLLSNPALSGRDLIEVQYVAKSGPMSGPTFFTTDGRVVSWEVGPGFATGPFSAISGGRYATVELTPLAPPISRLRWHYIDGLVPHVAQPYTVATTLAESSSVHVSPFMKDRLRQAVRQLRHGMTSPIREIDITGVHIYTEHAAEVSAHVVYRVYPGPWNGWLGIWSEQLTWTQRRGSWTVSRVQGPNFVKPLPGTVGEP